MDHQESRLYGLIAKFSSAEELITAVERVVQAGYRNFDAYTPYPVENLGEAMHLKPSPLPFIILAGGILGGVGGFFMQTYATVVDLPLNIGGRPLFSWPAYIPITFELTILIAAVAGVLGLFVVTRFPQPYHPVFRSQDFVEHASSDGFYLGIESIDPGFNLDRTRQFLLELGAVQVDDLKE